MTSQFENRVLAGVALCFGGVLLASLFVQCAESHRRSENPDLAVIEDRWAVENDAREAFATCETSCAAIGLPVLRVEFGLWDREQITSTGDGAPRCVCGRMP